MEHLNIIPNLSYKFFIICDKRKAVINAVKTRFPTTTTLKFCFFHRKPTILTEMQVMNLQKTDSQDAELRTKAKQLVL